MSNPLFNEYGGSLADNAGLSQFLKTLDEFEKNFKGDARAEVQKLLDSGQMTQQQFNQLGQAADRIMRMRRK